MYYPKNRIVNKQQSKNGELVTINGEPFMGEYFMTYDGKYFSGIYPPKNTTIQLQKVNNTKYNERILKLGNNTKYGTLNPTFNLLEFNEPTPYYPKPTEQNYSEKYIIRYFAKQRKIRMFKLLEISKEVYESIKNRDERYDYAGWDVTSLFWQISGILNDVNVGGIPTKAGVIDTNSRIVRMKTRNFPGLDKYLTNFQEFYRP